MVPSGKVSPVKTAVITILVALIVYICVKYSGSTLTFLINDNSNYGVAKDSITVGTFLALTGPGSDLGIPIKKGIEAYVAYVNDNGGIHGRKLKYIIRDDYYEADKALEIVKDLVEEEKVLAIGPALGAEGTLAVKPYLIKNKIPLVHPMNGLSAVALPVHKYVFPVQPMYINEAGFIVKYSKERLISDNIGIIYVDNDYGLEGLEGVKKAVLENRLNLVYEGKVDPNQVDFSEVIEEARANGTESLIVYGILNIFVGVLKEAQLQDFHPYFLTFYPNFDMSLYELTNKKIIDDNDIFITSWIPEADMADPKYLKFVEIYRKYNGGEMPSGLASAGFAGAELIVEGLDRAGYDITREKFINALETLNGFSGIQLPPVSYGRNVRIGVTEMQMFKAGPDGFISKTERTDLRDLNIRYKYN